MYMLSTYIVQRDSYQYLEFRGPFMCAVTYSISIRSNWSDPNNVSSLCK